MNFYYSGNFASPFYIDNDNDINKNANINGNSLESQSAEVNFPRNGNEMNKNYVMKLKEKVDNILIDLQALKSLYSEYEVFRETQTGDNLKEWETAENSQTLLEPNPKRNALVSTLKTKIRRSKPLRAGSDKFIPSISIGKRCLNISFIKSHKSNIYLILFRNFR